MQTCASVKFVKMSQTILRPAAGSTRSESKSPEGPKPVWRIAIVTSARSDRRLQLVGQGSQNLVKFAVPQGLFLLGSPAPPQQPHLKVSEEELRDLWPLLEACKTTTTVSGSAVRSSNRRQIALTYPLVWSQHWSNRYPLAEQRSSLPPGGT